MYYDMKPIIPQDVQNQLNQNFKNKQKQFTAADIEINSTAEIVANSLYLSILDFQRSLPEEDDVAIEIVIFTDSITLLVDSIGYIGYNLVWFGGVDSSGKPLKLVQHIQQVNFLLKVAAKPAPELPKRKIGFVQV